MVSRHKRACIANQQIRSFNLSRVHICVEIASIPMVRIALLVTSDIEGCVLVNDCVDVDRGDDDVVDNCDDDDDDNDDDEKDDTDGDD